MTITPNLEYDVIIPNKNGIHYISNAIESVLNQSLPAKNIYIVDDNSSDGSVKYIKANFPKVNLLHSPSSGQAKALDFAISKIKSEFVSFLDADDYWNTEKQKKQMNLIVATEGISYITSGVRNFIENPDGTISTKDFPNAFTLGAMTFKSKVVREIPLAVHDQDLSWLFSFYDRIRLLPSLPTNSIELNRRIHEQNTTLLRKSEYVESIFNYLRRRS